MAMSGSLEVPLQVTLRNVPHSEALDAEIRRRAAKLEALHPRLSSCRIALERLGAHQRQGQEFRVRIDVRAPGQPECVVDRSHDEDLAVAVRDAFDAVTRQLEEQGRAQDAAKRKPAVGMPGT
jgi:ribosome-associated translation inhibitor RaiA